MKKFTVRELKTLAEWATLLGYDGPNGPGQTGGGYNERADILVQAADGSNLNEIWAEIQETLTIWNQQRTTLMNRLVYTVTEPLEHVGIPGTVDFEVASEYGQPRSGGGYTYYNRGYDFAFYDLAMRYTWMFLAEASGDQVRNLNNMALEADNRLIFNKIMKTLFNPLNLTTGIADSNIPTTVFKFYNGDGEIPPPYKNNTFAGSHNHYGTTDSLATASTFGSATMDAVEADMKLHGYTPVLSGTQLVVMMNPQEAMIARQFKVLTGAKYDFMPNANYGGGVYIPFNSGVVGAPKGIVPEEIGTYGPWHIIEEQYVPPGYMAFLASGGDFSLENPVGFREHKNPAYQGLKMIPGARSDYPLTDSFYRRGFGTGIRQRGAGFVVQVTSGSTYTVPSIYS